MENQNKFDYGETIRIKVDAPLSFRPGDLGEICGMRTADGGAEYTVEYPDGSSKEIEEKYIEKHIQSV